MTNELGTLFKVDPQAVFAEGSGALTRWLALHLDIVGDALGMQLQPAGDNRAASGAAADFVARDARRDQIVIFCSQASPSDEHQLGRLITVAGDEGARAVVWVGTELRRSHRQALEWFNRNAAEDGIKFYALGLELFRVDDSKPGVVLRLLEAPGEHHDVGATPTDRTQPKDETVAAAAARGRDERPEFRADKALDEDVPQLGPQTEDARSAAAPVAAALPDSVERDAIVAAPADARASVESVDREVADPALAAGNQAEAYRKFFQQMVDELREKHGFTDAKPALAQNWYSVPSSVGGINYSIWFTSNARIRAELYIDFGDRDVNKEIFARIQGLKAEIEKEFGAKLEWDANQGGRAYTVSTSVSGKIEDPPEVLEKNLKLAISRLVSFKEVFGRRLPAIVRSLPPKPAPVQRPVTRMAPNRA